MLNYSVAELRVSTDLQSVGSEYHYLFFFLSAPFLGSNQSRNDKNKMGMIQKRPPRSGKKQRFLTFTPFQDEIIAVHTRSPITKLTTMSFGFKFLNGLYYFVLPSIVQ